MQPHEKLAEIGARQWVNLAELKRLVHEHNSSTPTDDPESRRPEMSKILEAAAWRDRQH